MTLGLDRLPQHVSEFLSTLNSPQLTRKFCVNYHLNSSALEHFSIQELAYDSQLWLIGTKEADQRNEWLEEVYPKDIKGADDMAESVLQCGKCKQYKVDYYQKQTRGADEPMTLFCHCLNCGARWRQ